MLRRTPAAIAAPAPPPAARTASAPNCAEPAKTIADITIGATLPITGSASTPKEVPRSSEAREIGAPARIPALSPPSVSSIRPKLAAGVAVRGHTKKKRAPEGARFQHGSGECHALEPALVACGALRDVGEALADVLRPAGAGLAVVGLRGVEPEARDHDEDVAGVTVGRDPVALALAGPAWRNRRRSWRGR